MKKMMKKDKAILFTVVSCFSAPKSVNDKHTCLCGWFSLHCNDGPWNPSSSRIFPGQRVSECLCQTKQNHSDALGQGLAHRQNVMKTDIPLTIKTLKQKRKTNHKMI